MRTVTVDNDDYVYIDWDSNSQIQDVPLGSTTESRTDLEEYSLDNKDVLLDSVQNSEHQEGWSWPTQYLLTSIACMAFATAMYARHL